MKLSFAPFTRRAIVPVVFALAGPAAIFAATPAAPTGPEVLTLMRKVADWQLAHPSAHEATDWPVAAFDTGAMALAQTTHDEKYYEAMRTAGEAAHWGLYRRPSWYHADDQCIGQTYLRLYLHQRDAKMIAPLRERLDWILAHPKDNNVAFDQKTNPDFLDRWSWCDSLYMAPTTWVLMSVATGDARYRQFAIKQWWVTSDYLFDPTEGLYFRDSTYFHRREPNGKKVFWSRGNGWVMGGLVHMLELLPADDPARPRFEAQFKTMAASILACQPADGLWRPSLLDPASYPIPESSGSGFFCYALAWGINAGLLDRAKYEPAVLRTWRALTRCVDAAGRLSHVQPIGSDPQHFPPEATETYGVGAFLLAGSEVYRLVATEPSGRGA